MLRGGGEFFDVDAAVVGLSLPLDSVWRKDEKRFPNSAANQQVNESSGFRIVASAVGFSEFPQQIEEVIAFLKAHFDTVRILRSLPGVEWLVLDFGAEIYPPGWSSFTFPPELLSLLGQVGVSLCLSVYPTEQDEETPA